ncbi:MAG: hypothetical protein GF344_01980 [Chitinivibrionales bacterium]|nr:hypothetical protein [Chitinivibrionales bacterium]MBD3355864.1 hypothetical protein [Chitinivibrionales bacterium]
MKMRKVVLIALIAVAIPLYAWDVYLLISGFMGSGGGHKGVLDPVTHRETPRIAALPVARYVKKGRSPFLAHKPEPKPKPIVRKRAVKRKRIRKPPPPLKPPQIRITGILWNPATPMAMLRLPDGSSTAAKAGHELAGGITVKKVEKNAVVIRYAGKEFRIEK